jgi:hypothetical protein
MEEMSQLTLVVAFAAALLISGQLFREHRPKTFDGHGVATESLRAMKKGAAFSRSSMAFQGQASQSEALVGLVPGQGL